VLPLRVAGWLARSQKASPTRSWLKQMRIARPRLGVARKSLSGSALDGESRDTVLTRGLRGTVKFADAVLECWNGHLHHTKLPRLPLPRRNHISLRLVVLSLLPQLSRRAGDDARARHPGLARSDPPVDAQVRRRVCTPPAETHRWLWRHVAPRRGVLQSQWRAGVSLARRGSGRGDPRCLGPEAAKREGSEALLPKAAQGIAIWPQSDCDRQAFKLRGSTRRGHAWGRTPKGRTTEQSSRELASTYSGAGATNAVLQVDPARAAFPLSAWPGLEPLPSLSPSTAGLSLSGDHAQALRRLAIDNRRCPENHHAAAIAAEHPLEPACYMFAHRSLKLTVPPRARRLARDLRSPPADVLTVLLASVHWSTRKRRR
jgi:hypothetical protein